MTGRVQVVPLPFRWAGLGTPDSFWMAFTPLMHAGVDYGVALGTERKFTHPLEQQLGEPVWLLLWRTVLSDEMHP